MPHDFEKPRIFLYGSLPIVVHNNDNHDAVISLDVAHNSGNGFLFNQVDADSLMKKIIFDFN